MYYRRELFHEFQVFPEKTGLYLGGHHDGCQAKYPAWIGYTGNG